MFYIKNNAILTYTISTVSNSVYDSNVFSLSSDRIVNNADASPINNDHNAILMS